MKKLSFNNWLYFLVFVKSFHLPETQILLMLLVKEDGDICIKKSPDLHTFKNYVDYAANDIEHQNKLSRITSSIRFRHSWLLFRCAVDCRKKGRITLTVVMSSSRSSRSSNWRSARVES